MTRSELTKKIAALDAPPPPPAPPPQRRGSLVGTFFKVVGTIVAVLFGVVLLLGLLAGPSDPRDSFVNVMGRLIAREIGARDWRFVNDLGTPTDVELVSDNVAHVRSRYRTKLHQWGEESLHYQARVERIGDRFHMRCFVLLAEIKEGKPSCF